MACSLNKNMPFNNMVFNQEIIAVVREETDKIHHESLRRLLEAAADKAVHGPSALAEKLGETPQTVTNWGRRGVSKQGAVKAQNRLGISATWTLEGAGDRFVRTLESVIGGPTLDGFDANRAALSNVEPGPDLKGLVPLISWVQAGDWHGAEDPLHPGEAEMWMPSPVRCSPGSFALRVRGDSMTAAHGNSRSYPEGSIIFVDPDRCMPVNGDRIVAKLSGSDDVTFKVYKNEDGRQWLQPLNPTHEPIREPFRVVGSVVGTWMPE